MKGVRLVISDACLGLVDALAEVFPEADWQRCVVHFYRSVFSHVPNGKVRAVAAMLKAIHAQENRDAAQRKAQEVIRTLKTMKLRTAAVLVDSAVGETFAFFAYPPQHWLKIKTNNPMERPMLKGHRFSRGAASRRVFQTFGLNEVAGADLPRPRY